MNLPNKITIARICLIPVFMVCMLLPFPNGTMEIHTTQLPAAHIAGLILFVIAASTDWLDGYYARKYQLVTNFGKFLDPLADKLLVTAALLVFVELQVLPAWMAVVIISREFAVTGMRLVAASDGEVIAASPLGKWKTVFQMFGLAVLFIDGLFIAAWNVSLGMVLIWIAVLLTIVSGIEYFWKNRHIFKHSM
ncbi:CDP-diacylglycerol--glycerol-3-phosphate 3-phosphatidyltransferase [Alteribacillus persepolensis]|uniref:CDP-diacylglycerol--glycerol-3-phosphate 3-phosphatidyltransferase n=1 Tax=Alteribacillus persepolensis TaxID=568899 RepID=A0A1G7YUP4_9BACI|nr:CDP-diacylglycerol--glycerol-3-phosphate 3-phosphatidyltransferase [Alteribacillus persepolensis]SDH00065.1 CDP-diacylglycerol--glycerol-3-phosphate 3-phosphatidyltransferase [Alteribacillus persepolensis]